MGFLLVNRIGMQYNNVKRGVTMKKIVENVKFIQDGTLVFGDLYLEDGFVERIDYKTPMMESKLAIPGFVDIHTHGCMGVSADECDPQQLLALAALYPSVGVTSFCPTISSRSLKEYEEVILAYRKAFQGPYKGARYMGLHLEGPYLNPEYRGALKRNQIHDINLAELEIFLSEYHEDIAIMTIACEMEHAQEAIRLLHLYGVEVSLGHTNATYEQTVEAFDLGATQITHLGNTMPKVNHREPSMMDAVFLGGCLCEIIMDGVHMQPYMLKWVIQLLGSKRICAISDSKYAGLDMHREHVIDEHISIINGAVYVDGELKRGCRDLLTTFRYLYREMHYDLMDCLDICSLNAAKMLKTYAHEIGLGKKIDLVILDHQLNLVDVIINGRSAA